MRIQIFVTGGTFDKEYNDVTEKLYFKDTHLSEVMKLARCKKKFSVKKLMMVDSWNMKKSHREIILKNCKKTEANRIVITHGTSTMEKTAKFLQKSNLNKTIVLTGAMSPYRFGSSDGFFNLGSAVAFVQVLPVGIYIAMNGEYFKAGEVKKNHAKARFEKIK
jgi:L-asparaginase